MVAAMPAKGRPLATHQSTHIDIALREQAHMLGLEVGSDHPNDTHRRKKSRRQRKEARRTAERVINAAVLRLDRVVPNRPDYDDAHLILIPSFLPHPPGAASRQNPATPSMRSAAELMKVTENLTAHTF